MTFLHRGGVFLLAVLVTSLAQASGGELIWARAMTGSVGAIGFGIAVDSAGAVYTTGNFEGTIDFDPGFGVLNLSSLGGEDVYIQKLNANGSLAWARSVGGTNDAKGTSIALDSLGNVYVTGDFAGTVDFDPGPGTFNLTSVAGTRDIFVLKLDASGNFVWARSMGASNNDLGQSIAVDAAGNVYTAGDFIGTVDFDPGPGVFNLSSTNVFTRDPFVQKLDTNGDFLWARNFGGVNDDLGWALTLSGSGDVFTTGEFRGTADFDPGVGVFNRTSAGDSDIFIQSMNSNGDFIGAVSMGGGLLDGGFSIAVDAAGNVYTTGVFRFTADFDPGPGTFDLSSAGDADIFVQKLNPSGELVWARRMGSTSTDIGFDIAVDSAGNVFTAGYFQGVVDFDPGPGVLNLVSAGGADAFVQKLDSNGDFLWASAFRGANNVQCRAIALDSAGDAYVTGSFVNTTDFDPGPGTYNMTSAPGNFGAFVVKLSGTDITPPNANSIVPTTVGPTNASSVSFTVTFDEAVQNFNNAADVVISHTGTANTGVSITGGPTVYTVTVTGISGDGSFTLAANTGSDIQDLAGNALASSVTSAAVFIDNTPPGVSIGAPSASPVNSAATVSFPVTVTGASVVNLLSANVSINHSGTADGSINILNGATANPTVEVSGVTGDGSYTITIAAGIATDSAANTSLATAPSAVVSVDNTPPGVSIGAPSASPVNSAATVNFPVTVTGASVVNLLSANVSINHSGTAGGSINILNGATANPTVEVSGVTGDGSYTITIAAGIATDSAANTSLATAPSAAVSVDNTPPGVSIGAPSASPVNSAATVNFPVTVTGASTVNLLSANVSINHSGTADGSINILNGATANPTVEVSGVTGDGSYTITIAAGIATDSAANTSLATAPSAGVSVDNTAPVFSNLVATPNPASDGDVVVLSFTVSEGLLADPDVTVNGVPATRIGPTLYSYEYPVMPGDPLGPASILISGFDSVGNAGFLNSSSALTIVDGSAPGLPLATWPLGLALAAIGALRLAKRRR